MSPIMHNAAFNKLRLDFVYVAFTVKTENLRNAMSAFRSLGIHGLNVTMPHKTACIGYLDDIDPSARFIGAVNTILNHDGKLVGFNTDGLGALNALKASGVDLKGKKLLLLGAGGAARAIAFHAAQEAKELTVLNRTVEKAEEFAERLSMRFDKSVKGDSLSPGTIRRELDDSDLLVNATSVGMQSHVAESLVDAELLRPSLCVMDAIYDPVETKLVRDAKSAGANAINGVEMLIHQAAASFEIWTNHRAPVAVMKEAVLNKLSEKVMRVDRSS